MSYQLQSNGSCAFRTYSCIVLIAVIIAVLIYAFKYYTSSLVSPHFQQSGVTRLRRTLSGDRVHPPRWNDYITRLNSGTLVPADAPVATALPSGMWSGYYTFAGMRHDVCEFNLEFSETGDIDGKGVDDVGRYDIAGRYGAARLAFSKQYIARSQNTAGVVHYGNQGHTVEYRGELAGVSLGSGFRGAWTIRATLGDYDGQFHLWPAMEGWADTAPAESSGATFEENECVVCYDRSISTCLRPCGHVALCGVCASRLNPRKCPLCRQNIVSVENRAPSPPANPSHQD